jgi:hypothetical protein
MSKRLFFELLKYSQKLEDSDQSLAQEDSELYNALRRFLIDIECNAHYFEKIKYIKILENFLINKITVKDFLNRYSSLYQEIDQELDEMLSTQDYALQKFLTPSRPGVDNLVHYVKSLCELFDLGTGTGAESEYCTIGELKSAAGDLLLRLQMKEEFPFNGDEDSPDDANGANGAQDQNPWQ